MNRAQYTVFMHLQMADFRRFLSARLEGPSKARKNKAIATIKDTTKPGTSQTSQPKGY